MKNIKEKVPYEKPSLNIFLLEPEEIMVSSGEDPDSPVTYMIENSYTDFFSL